MFSLVITIISVALVAVLALATLYYGGAAYTHGLADAQAAKVRIQSQQLFAATDLFVVHKGRMPLSVAELVNEDYLQSVPLAKAALQSALAESAWFMPIPGEALFLLETDFPEACRSINEESYGKRAILSGVLDDIQVQCYGPNMSALYSMAAKDPRAIMALVNAHEEDLVGSAPVPVLIPEVPADDNSADWSSPPGDDNANSGGGDNGNGGSTPTGVLTPYSSTLSLGTTTVGTPLSESFTFQNNGTGAMTLTTLNFSAAEFSATTNGCTGTLAAGATCSVTVQYAPTAVGSHSGTMTLVGSSDSSSVDLTGSATAVAAPVGVLEVSAAPTAFTANVGANSAPKTVTLSNTGAGPLTFTANPSLTGSAAFTLTSTCGASLAAGASCTLSVTFAPTNTIVQTGSLSFDTDVSTPSSFSLSGTGVEVLPTGYVTHSGLTWSYPGTSTYKWDAGSTKCAGTINGTTGWRLPTASELSSLALAKGTLNLAGLGWPNLGAGTVRYWSGSNVKGGGASAILMLDGSVQSKSTLSVQNVTCVHS